MNNSVKITGIIALAAVLIAFMSFTFINEKVPSQIVQVSGASSINVVPDKVSIYFNVETTAKTAKEAKDENSLITDELITALIKQGYLRQDIQTTSFNIWEEYDYSKEVRTFIGFKTSHQVKVLVKSNDLIGETIDAGVDAGASISYINFELSQELENQYKAQAIKLATEDAKMKAKAMADGLGAELGEIVSLTNTEFGYYPWMAYDSTSAVKSGQGIVGEAIETSIQPGERQVSASVSATYEIR